MNHYEAMAALSEQRLLPLYTATDMSVLDKAAELLLKHGLTYIEVTYRSDLASDAIRYLAENTELVVGAGTVRDVETAKDAIDNGARFIVCPGFDVEIVKYCQEQGVPVYPGTVTPSEIMAASQAGLDTVKFFPADIYGGLNAIRALKGPFFDMAFIPTGGVNGENYLEFLREPVITAVGGSFIISEGMIKQDGGVTADRNLETLVAGVKGL